MNKITGAPERIYLNMGDFVASSEPEPFAHWQDSGEVTWCEHGVDEHDIAYVRADVADELLAALKGLLTCRDTFPILMPAMTFDTTYVSRFDTAWTRARSLIARIDAK